MSLAQEHPYKECVFFKKLTFFCVTFVESFQVEVVQNSLEGRKQRWQTQQPKSPM